MTCRRRRSLKFDPAGVDPETAALSVGSRWELGEVPIGHMVHLLEAHGVRVFSLAGECREIDAFSFWRDGTPFVCLNMMKTAEHAIFDAAHELGHLVMHRGHSTPRGREEEQEANSFASSFLMPRSDVLSVAPRFPGLKDIVRAKARWRVSAAALSYRLHKLGIISDWHYRELCIELSRAGRHREPNPITRERSQLLEKAFAVMRAEGVKRSDVAADLHLHQRDLNAMVFGLVVSSIDGAGKGASNVGAATLRLL